MGDHQHHKFFKECSFFGSNWNDIKNGVIWAQTGMIEQSRGYSNDK